MPEGPSDPSIGVEEIRRELKDLLHPKYDTQYNILRWLQGANYNVPKATHMLKKHLKWRKEKKLDTDQSLLQQCKISQEYSPLSIIGPTGPHSDRLIVVDQAGKIDINGVMKSVVPTEYIHQLFRNVEKIHEILNKMESELGVQCSVYYIFDLDGLSFDPSVVSTVTGPFRISWELIAFHYREWIDKFIVINTPAFLNVLWSAIAPFIPEDGKKRVVFPGKNWKDELLTLCDADHLPQRYGGNLSDTVLSDPKPVPKEKFWSPQPGSPHIHHLHRISIPASKTRVLYYKCAMGSSLRMYSQNDSELQVGLYFGKEMDTPEDELDVLVPWCPRAGLPAIDNCELNPSENGFYQFHLCNQASWLLASTFRILVVDSNGNELEAINQKEKWIKLGQKFSS